MLNQIQLRINTHQKSIKVFLQVDKHKIGRNWISLKIHIKLIKASISKEQSCRCRKRVPTMSIIEQNKCYFKIVYWIRSMVSCQINKELIFSNSKCKKGQRHKVVTIQIHELDRSEKTIQFLQTVKILMMIIFRIFQIYKWNIIIKSISAKFKVNQFLTIEFKAWVQVVNRFHDKIINLKLILSKN